MEQLLVRKAEPTDAAGVTDLLAETGHLEPHADVPAQLRWFSRSGADHVLLAVSGQSIVGVLALTVVPQLTASAPVGQVTALIVRAREERNWIERALLGEAEALAKRHRCAAVELIGRRPTPDGGGGVPRELGYESIDPTEVRFRKELATPEPIRI